MRREGRLRGKPASKSRHTTGRRRKCEEKALTKRKHRGKRFATDSDLNPDLADFFFREPALTLLRDDEEDETTSNLLCVDRKLATVNSVIEAAFGMDFTSYELGGGVDGMDDIAAIELAFQRQLGIFENAVEGSSFSEFATQGWSTLSEESWSDVELDEDEDVDVDADWTLVDDVDGAKVGEKSADSQIQSNLCPNHVQTSFNDRYYKCIQCSICEGNHSSDGISNNTGRTVHLL